MGERKDDAEELYRLISKATFGETQILGGVTGDGGMARGLKEELMKQTAIICGKIRSDSLSDDEINNYLAMCNTAVATNIISESDFNKILGLVEGPGVKDGHHI